MIQFLVIFVASTALLFVSLRMRFMKLSTEKKEYPIFIKKLVIFSIVSSLTLYVGQLLIGELDVLPLLLVFIGYVMVRSNIFLPLLISGELKGITLKGMQSSTHISDLIMLVVVFGTYLSY